MIGDSGNGSGSSIGIGSGGDGVVIVIISTSRLITIKAQNYILKQYNRAALLNLY